MPKDVSNSVRDSLSQALTAITQGMTAPDAMPIMPALAKLQNDMLQLVHMGQGSAGPRGPGGPPQGGPPPGGPPQGGPPGGPQAPGPPPAPMANAGGQGLFPNSPQPNAQELQQLMASASGR